MLNQELLALIPCKYASVKIIPLCWWQFQYLLVIPYNATNNFLNHH